MLTTTLGGRFKEADDDLATYVRQRVEAYTGPNAVAWDVLAYCTPIPRTANYRLRVTIRSLKPWAFNEELSEESLTTLDGDYDVFKERVADSAIEEIDRRASGLPSS